VIEPHSFTAAIVFVAVAFTAVEVVARVTRRPVPVYVLALGVALWSMATDGTPAGWFAFAASGSYLWVMLR
jgi:hypothetical protein